MFAKVFFVFLLFEVSFFVVFLVVVVFFVFFLLLGVSESSEISEFSENYSEESLFSFATHRHAATVGDASICFASRGICNLNQEQLHRSEPSDEIIRALQ